MTTTADEQYRPGFGAWMKSQPGYPFAAAFANLMWKSWTASKRDASTEPSERIAVYSQVCVPKSTSEYKELYTVAEDGTARRFVAHVPSAADAKRLCDAWNAGGGALPDEAKDTIIEAARKLVKCKGRYHTELNFKALADAIAAHDKNGSAK